MDETNLLYLLYGMCIMFHLMMGWVFCCQKRGLAKKLIGLLMLLVAVQYSKDLVLLRGFYSGTLIAERVASSIDIVTVPLYVLVLIEFCRPGCLTLARAFAFEAPFLLLSFLFMLTSFAPLFYAMVALAAVYGVWCAAWTLHELPLYHRRLKEEYSYDEDINLHWLRGVMAMFFLILMIWVASNVWPSPFADILYMASSLVGWAVVCYFINKQETVLREVFASTDSQPQAGQAATATTHIADEETFAALRQRISNCFDEQKVYLDPKLRLSELAAKLGTNRTYLSQFFNQSCDKSFYEYVNNYRVRHAMELLRTTDYTLEVVASMSGFNSMSTFRRAFTMMNGCSPMQYREENK